MPNISNSLSLYHAAIKGIEALQHKLKKENLKINVQDKDGNTALHTAAFATDDNASKVIATLKEAGADVTIANNNGDTPLHAAALSGAWKNIDELIPGLSEKKLNAKNKKGETPLHIAAEQGHIKAIQILIEAGTKANMTDSEGCTAMYLAAEHKRPNAIAALKSLGGDPSTPNKKGLTPLHAAAMSGNLKSVNELLAALLPKKTKLNVKDHANQTPLHYAALWGFTEIVSILLESGANASIQDHNNDTPLNLVNKLGYQETVRLLEAHLKKYPDGVKKGEVEEKTKQESQTTSGNTVKTDLPLTTPLHQAVLQGNAAVKAELKKGVGYVNVRDQYGRTPIFIAAAEGHTETIKILIGLGALIDIRDNRNRTPIYVAAQQGNYEAIIALHQENSSLLNARNGDDDTTPLCASIDMGCSEATVTTLLNLGANATIITKKGTALQMAQEAGNIKIITLLETHLKQYPDGVKNGVVKEKEKQEFQTTSKNTSNVGRTTPLHTAARESSEAVIRELQNGTADVNTIDKDGLTPIHITAGLGYVAAIKALHLAGAKIDVQDNEGRTPLYRAVTYEQVDAVSTLLEVRADISIKTKQILTVFHLAANSNSLTLIPALVRGLQEQTRLNPQLNADAILNAESAAAYTALQTAVKTGKKVAIEVLLEAGANANVRTQLGTALEIAQTAGYRDGINILETHIKKYPSGVKPDAKALANLIATLEKKSARTQKKTSNQQKISNKTPTVKSEKNKEQNQEKPAQAQNHLEKPQETKPISVKILFSNMLQEKIKDITKIRHAINTASCEQEGLKKDIVKKIIRSNEILKTKLIPNKEQLRLNKLIKNLSILNKVENICKKIIAQEHIINTYSELYNGIQTALTTILTQEQRLELLTNMQLNAKSENTFSWPEFYKELIKLGIEGLEDSQLKQALEALQKQWDVIAAANKEFSRLLSELNRYNAKLDKQVTACTDLRDEFCLQASSSLPTPNAFQLDIDKQIKDISTKIKQKLEQEQVVGCSVTIEPTAMHGANPTIELVWYRHCRTQRQENLEVRNDSESKEIKESTEERQLPNIPRLVAFNALKKAEELARKKAAQDLAKQKERDYVAAGGTRAFPPCENMEEETKITVEQSSSLNKGLIELNREMEKLELIIEIAKRDEWTQETIYALLQSLAYMNEYISASYWGNSVLQIAKSLRNLIYKDPQTVLDTVISGRNLLSVAEAWMKFLKSEIALKTLKKGEDSFLKNEGFVLEKIQSPFLSTLYQIGKNLSRDIDLKTGMAILKQMLDFGDSQKYEKACNLRLMRSPALLNDFSDSITKGHEIIIAKEQDTFVVYYKDKQKCVILQLNCSEDLNVFLADLVDNDEILNGDNTALFDGNDSRFKDLYTRVYAAVMSKEGCTSRGEDIISEQAKQFYWAVTDKLEKALRNAIKKTPDAAVSHFLNTDPRIKSLRMHREARSVIGVAARHPYQRVRPVSTKF